MARWAVTGASGYIGTALCRTLVAQGHDVRTLVGDVRDAAAVEQLVATADVVVHLAAYVHRRASSRAQQRECHAVNVEGTRVVTDAVMRRAPAAFLEYISSANVYGPSTTAAVETVVLEPRTFYGRTKVEAEQVVRDAIARGLRAAILRPAMVFGPGAPGNLARLVGFVRRGVVLMLGSGENRKTLAPIERLVAAMIAVASAQEITAGEVYNVGGTALSLKTILDTIADELAVKPRTIRLPLAPVKGAAWLFDTLTGWTPAPSVRQMVETYVAPSLIDDSKLSQLPSFRDQTDATERLRATVRALSASR